MSRSCRRCWARVSGRTRSASQRLRERDSHLSQRVRGQPLQAGQACLQRRMAAGDDMRIPGYSLRKASIRLIRLARNTGTEHATRPIMREMAADPPNTNGSTAGRPKRLAEISRPAIDPSTRPSPEPNATTAKWKSTMGPSKGKFSVADLLTVAGVAQAGGESWHPRTVSRFCAKTSVFRE